MFKTSDLWATEGSKNVKKGWTRSGCVEYFGHPAHMRKKLNRDKNMVSF